MRNIVILGALLIAVVAVQASAQEHVSTSGLDGRELTAVAFSQEDPDVLFVGTQDGLFVKDVASKADFRRVRGVPFENCPVNEIRAYAYSQDVLAATEKGLFVVDALSLKAKEIFGRSDPNERACVSAVLLENGAMVVATRAGLFGRGPGEAEWLRLPVPFADGATVALFGAGQVVYAAAPQGVYRSTDGGQIWEKVFDAMSPTYEAQTSSEEEDSLEEEEKRVIVDMAGLEAGPDTVCLATTFGVFQTHDGARSWQALPLSGLAYAAVRKVYIHPALRQVLCLTRTGLYLMKDEAWVELCRIFEGRSMVGFGTDVLYATKTGLYTVDPLMQSQIAASSTGTVQTAAFIHEPSVEEVQRMATDYAEVSNSKIRDWRRRACLKALLPEFTLAYDKVVYGSSTGAFAVGPRDWGVSLKWELGEMIYNPDQTSIDTRSKLMVQLRNDILAEVTRLYFERRRLQMELVESGQAGQKRIDKELRLQELTALINRLTGGNFIKVLKRLN